MASLQGELTAAREAFARGDLATAERLLEKALRRAPKHSGANELIAYVRGRMGDAEGAMRHLRAATAAPDASDTSWYYLGVAHMRAGKAQEAEQAFRRAIALNAALFEAEHDLGRVLHAQARFDAALEAFGRARSLKPGSYEVLHNTGRALAALGRYDEALAAYDESIRLNRSSPQTWLNRGETLHDLGRLDAALESYAAARALRPAYPEAASNAALALLAKGDYEAGWPAFEARWDGAGAIPNRHAAVPRWDGRAPLAGKSVLVWSEQGYGDTIQFCRYVPLLAERGARVILEVQPDLKALLALNVEGPVAAVGETLPAFDLQVPMLSLPLVFGTRLDTVPNSVPYLRADARKVAQWSARMGPHRGRPRVAIASSGRLSYRHEARRRIAVRELAALAAHCDLYLVQKDLYDEDRQFLAAGGSGVTFLGDAIEDFTDGSAIVENVDLVISIDTSFTHVAGAMGKPVWLLLSDVPDWRWMRERLDSPWYPTLRIFRQSGEGSWSRVLGQVAEALRLPR
jgi:tetratricopeptide (TPR) repeat protein